MKPCTEYREAITLLAAHSLDASAKGTTERHLQSCRACRDHFENLRRVCGQLEQMPQDAAAPALPSNFHRRLVERVRADVEKPETPSAFAVLIASLREWCSWPRVAYVGAVGVVILMAVMSMDRGVGSRDPRIKVAGVPQPVRMVQPPAPTLMALSRALNDSEAALDALLARQEQLLAVNDPPTMAMASSGVIW